MIPISVIVVTKNAAAQIEACLKSLQEFKQVLMVDSESQDHTVGLARHFKNVQIVSFKWNRQYPKKRQWCLDYLHLKYDWVLFVDADEVLTPELKEELRDLFKEGSPEDVPGYFISGQYVWNGITLRFGLRNNKISLFNRRKMMFPVVNDLSCPGMGELEGHYQPVLKPESKGEHIGSLKAPLLHYANHLPEEWLRRHKRYAAWEICMNKKNAWPEDPIPRRNTLKEWMRESFFRPEFVFLYSYILKLGFKDGAAGFDFAKSRYIYYHMIRRGRYDGNRL